MSFLPQSKALSRIRTRLLAFAFGVLISTLAGSALADVGCLLSGGPYETGAPVQVIASNTDEFSWPEPYTVLWGDGTTTSGIAPGQKSPLPESFFTAMMYPSRISIPPRKVGSASQCNFKMKVAIPKLSTC
jgi:hypothetical protein